MVVREEVINVMLGQELHKRNLVAISEQILKIGKGRKKLPDVLIGLYEGLVINIEGKFDSPQGRKIVEQQCKDRIDQGIAQLSIAVCYDEKLKMTDDFNEITKLLQTLSFTIKIFTVSGTNSPQNLDWSQDTSSTGFIKCKLDNLANIINDSYDELISDKSIETNVEIIENLLDDSVRKLASQTRLTPAINKLITTAYAGAKNQENA
tara:strand:- start:700 stop:1320 length:621 start_codon:yes stop_codon:yes gene_type:complete